MTRGHGDLLGTPSCSCQLAAAQPSSRSTPRRLLTHVGAITRDVATVVDVIPRRASTRTAIVRVRDARVGAVEAKPMGQDCVILAKETSSSASRNERLPRRLLWSHVITELSESSCDDLVP